MKKVISFLLCGLLIICLSACGGNNAPIRSDNSENVTGSTDDGKTDTQADNIQNGNVDTPNENSDEQLETTEKDASSGSNILVAVFSLANEQYEVGVIEKGNTQIVAEIIAEQTGADLFSIESTENYPTTYEGLLEKSREEENNPPQIAGTVENMSDYEVIFVGYPNWWGTLPQALYSFLEEYDFSGKTILPLCTHEGSRMGSSERAIAELCPDAILLDGLAIRGANASSAQSDVETWINIRER